MRGRSLRTRLIGCLTALLCGAPSLFAAEPLPVEEIAPGVYLHQGPHEEATPRNLGGFANVGFIVGEQAVAVIDSGGSAAHGMRLRAAIRTVTDLPIRYLVITHMHPDHALGSTAFAADRPTIVGHFKLARALAARGAHYLAGLQDAIGDLAAGTQAVPPSLTVEQSLTLDLGARRLRLTAHPTAHSDNDLTVFDEDSGTLWLGDLLFIERIPAVDGSLKGWLSVMEELRGWQAARVVPGHGPVSTDWPGALDDQARYLGKLLAEIRAVIARNGSIEEAVASVAQDERGKWQLFEAYHARNIVTAFTELEWE